MRYALKRAALLERKQKWREHERRGQIAVKGSIAAASLALFLGGLVVGHRAVGGCPKHPVAASVSARSGTASAPVRLERAVPAPAAESEGSGLIHGG
ncbi:MAG: hypothetical protein QM723_07015 [Myxococcaceae bacterium]